MSVTDSQGLGIILFYCLAVEAGFNSDMIECLHVDWDRLESFQTMASTINDQSSDHSEGAQ